MPRKDKVIQAAQRKELLAKLDNPPPHIKARMGSPPRLTPLLEPQPDSYTGWNGLVRMGDGQLARSPDHGAAANRLREAEALRKARAMAEQFPEELWQRNGANAIAEELGIHPSTVRRARQRLRNAQAK